jgi:tryptophan-rich sensory protein
VFLGFLSGRLANSGYGNRWFDALVKPDFMPPGWAFGVAWTILYILMGLALAMVIHARGARGRGVAIILFLVQLLLNLAWSPLFFRAHQVDNAFAVRGGGDGVSFLAHSPHGGAAAAALSRMAGLCIGP